MILASACAWTLLASPCYGGIHNTGGTAAPIRTGSEFRVTGKTGNRYSGEIWVEKFVVEKGATLRVESTAVATPPPMAILMVHARDIDVSGRIEATSGSWVQLDVDRKIKLSGILASENNGRFRVNGCPVARWSVANSFTYDGQQPLELYGAPQEVQDGPLKNTSKSVTTCEALFPQRTPPPKGMKGAVRIVDGDYDTGRVKQGVTVEHKFIVKNVGKETLWVGNAKTS